MVIELDMGKLKKASNKELRKSVKLLFSALQCEAAGKSRLIAQRDKLQKENDELQMIINDLSSVLEKHKII